MSWESLIDPALRASALGAATWVALKLLRLRHPQLRMTVWTVVLGVSIAMPALTPWIRIPIPAQWSAAKLILGTTASNETPAPVPPKKVIGSWQPRASPPERASSARVRAFWTGFGHLYVVDWFGLLVGTYVCVAIVMLLRLIHGTHLALRIARAAHPVRHPFADKIDLRVSDAVAVPVTVGSVVLLPQSHVKWSERTFRAVLLHEGSHVRHRDFHVLWLAALYRAVFWFNPFSWWLRAHLGDLAEMVSDDAALEVLPDRDGYAQILLEMAALPERALTGLAMAQSNTVQQRVRRILSETSLYVRPSLRKRLLVVLALAPVAALSAGTLEPYAAGDSVASGSSLDQYVGEYQINPTSLLAVTREGEQLFGQTIGRYRLALRPSGENQFTSENGAVVVSFQPGADGLATAVLIHESNRPVTRAERIDTQRAREVDATFQRRAATVPERFKDQSPVPGGAAVLQKTISDLQRGSPDYSAMSLSLADKIRQVVPRWQPMMLALGDLVSIEFKAVGPGGYDHYSVQFAHGRGDFPIDLAPDGKLEDIVFDPAGDGTPGSLESCALEATLDSSHETAPIKLSLINRSGSDLQLFELDAAGRRVRRGRFYGDGRVSGFLTYIHRPLVIADESGQCREIVLPGLATRVHVIEPPGLPTEKRSAQLPGSDQLLQQYIDGVRRGAPVYERMTSDASALTHERLPRQRAILTTLGTLETMSFQGISDSGSDQYRVQFANGSTEWQIRLAHDGRIAEVALGPQCDSLSPVSPMERCRSQ